MAEPHPLEDAMDLGHWEFFKLSCVDGVYTDFMDRFDDRTRPVQLSHGTFGDVVPFIRISDLVDFDAPLPKEDRVGSTWTDLTGKTHTNDPFRGVVS